MDIQKIFGRINDIQLRRAEINNENICLEVEKNKLKKEIKENGYASDLCAYFDHDWGPANNGEHHFLCCLYCGAIKEDTIKSDLSKGISNASINQATFGSLE